MATSEKKFDAQSFLNTVEGYPGVYIFFDAEGNALYVGKARNLKKRLQSYFKSTGLALKTQLMTSKIAHAEIQRTITESEALLLENNLIKNKRPRYNILLRDDKSFPYIRLVKNSDYPRFIFYRGARSKNGEYFGPYPRAAAVRETLNNINKIFRLRQCNDAFFQNRSRPCLQYQIKRCSAPCVNLIDKDEYAEDVRQARAMLAGQNKQLMEQFAKEMELASNALNYERAAVYRDRISNLQSMWEKQYVSAGASDADVVMVALASGLACFGVVSIRQGKNLGVNFQIKKNVLDQSTDQLLGTFLPQYYLGTKIPTEILLGDEIDRQSIATLQQVFSAANGSKVEIRIRCRSHRARWLESARINCVDYLQRYLSEHSQIDNQFVALARCLKMAEVPERMECFDISHTMGEEIVGSCVVFNHQGPVKSDYRKFNVSDITPGDDYAAMRQVLTRRYKRMIKSDSKLPDLIIIDGGKGQLGVAANVLEELQILDSLTLISVSKGPRRKAGEEQFHVCGWAKAMQPKSTSPESHLVQRIRNEAHRFAVTGHRQRRSKARMTSPLAQIEGIGDKRSRTILRYFGGIREVRRAGVEDLSRVPGISPTLAQKIYDRFNDD